MEITKPLVYLSAAYQTTEACGNHDGVFDTETTVKKGRRILKKTSG